ncbi:unnamed protein product [Didymodactylos carnosus]|uniref:Uncharacterized protein n=1 Tax=Didymodactylos carnosus TaxID=1234261 RepID=A0A816BRK9_9BILA|nr:unnamed protein product [Didymodactylos carnosus]CAF1614985.1 unnamed protein product [Didymodactylos carnosus]CAF4228682.1 unnamed protein product [Didymodactylos carnosus]CAF4500570.1 unnamed protein product [Didymodactylos carnosus]
MTTNTRIGTIQNAALSFNYTNFTWLNGTSTSCICQALRLSFASDIIAMNTYSSNLTCQLFTFIPNSYQIISSNQSKVLVLKPFPPSISPCCLITDMENIIGENSYTSASVNLATNIMMDNSGHIVVVNTDGYMIAMNPDNLSTNSSKYIDSNVSRYIFFNNYYYFTLINSIVIYNSSKVYVTNLTTASKAKGIAGLNNQIFVTFCLTNTVIIYNQLSNGALTLNMSLTTLQQCPSGITSVNQTTLYIVYFNVTKVDQLIYNETGLWTIKPFFTYNTTGGAQEITSIRTDSCQRIWIVPYYGFLIFDQFGRFIDSLSISNNPVDLFFTTNYSVYVTTDYKLKRYVSNISC